MVVVRQERDRYGIVLYGLINGYISDNAYESLVSEYPLPPLQLRPRSFGALIESQELPFEDTFILYMHMQCIVYLVNDLTTEFFRGRNQIDPELRQLFERAILFLSTDLEFEWEVSESNLLWDRTIAKIAPRRATDGPFRRLRKRFGLPVEDEAPLSGQEGTPDAGWNCWPFRTGKEYREARQRWE